jgi:hypothetical protein
VKYMILIQSNAQFMERWAALSDDSGSASVMPISR